jgi:hypothetical protein
MAEVSFRRNPSNSVRPDTFSKGVRGRKEDEEENENEGFPRPGCDFVAPGHVQDD